MGSDIRLLKVVGSNFANVQLIIFKEEVAGDHVKLSAWYKTI